MKYLLFWGILLAAIGCAEAQVPMDSISSALTFPATYVGTWRGDLEVFTPEKGRVQTLPMELEVRPLTDSSYTYTIIYGEDREAGKRAYELVVRDAQLGLYYIDERNSIGMEAYLIGDVFVQRFEVMNNMLDTQTRLRPDGTLLWEIASGPLQPVSRSGGVEWEGEDIPPVSAYPIRNYQRAVLRRE